MSGLSYLLKKIVYKEEEVVTRQDRTLRNTPVNRVRRRVWAFKVMEMDQAERMKDEG